VLAHRFQDRQAGSGDPQGGGSEHLLGLGLGHAVRVGRSLELIKITTSPPAVGTSAGYQPALRNTQEEPEMAVDASSEGPPTEPSTGAVRRAIAASSIGNMTEWLDYGLYAYGVSFISAAIFPGSTEQATLFALATFAISFLVRPLGGLFWGPLGDRVGRKTVLAITILMMAAATLGVGLVPTYDAIGFWAPVLLIALRLVQGFSTGGEYGGAATFMAEYAPDRRRGFFGSFLEFGTLTGFSLGTGVMLGFQLALSDDAMMSWGWRVPFMLALPMGLIGLYMRNKLEDTPVFQELEERGEVQEKSSLRELIRSYWRPMLVMGGLVVA